MSLQEAARGAAKLACEVHRRGAWIVISQTLSSLTNMLLGVAALRYGDDVGFGSYAVAFLAFQIAISLSRALISEPFLIEFGGKEIAHRDVSAASRDALAATVVFGTLIGVVTAVAASSVGGAARVPLLVMAVVLPAAVVQDFARLLFIATGRPRLSARSDGTWLVLFACALPLLVASGRTSVPTMIAGWGVGGIAAAAIAAGRIRAQAVAHKGSARRWFTVHRRISGHITTELVLSSGGLYLALGLVGVVGGIVALGAVRAAFLIVAPLQLLYQAAQAFAIPEFARARAERDASLRKLTVWLAASLVGMSTAWLAALAMTPRSVGERVFRDGWELAGPLLVGVAVLMIAEAALVASRVALRVLKRTDRSLAARAIMSPLVIAGSVAGVTIDGAKGAVWGMAFAQLAGAAMWWIQLILLSEWRRGRKTGVLIGDIHVS